jgi:hypothetical protein
MRTRLFHLALAAGMLALAVAPTSTAQRNKITLRHPVFLGPASLEPSGASGKLGAPREVDPQAVGRQRAKAASAQTGTQAPAGATPNPSFAIGGTNLTFNALDSVDSANVNFFDIEPPSQGLCVGNNFEVEVINLVMAIYDNVGNLQKGPIAINQFFLRPADIVMSGPRCYYDTQDKRFFITMEDIDFNNSRSYLDIAVSNDSNPLHGFGLFQIDTTDDGTGSTPLHANCPCFGDQPLIGADQNGFYISTNEMAIFSQAYNGVEIYAMSKSLLEGFALGTVVQFGNVFDGPFAAYSIQPATSPNLSPPEPAGGTEFFLATRNFPAFSCSGGHSTLGVWAITGTSSLANVTPSLRLQEKVVSFSGLSYSCPPPVTQKSGSVPLATADSTTERKLNVDDDRMQQTVFAGGLLQGALTTNDNSDLEAFAVQPSISGTGTLTATLVHKSLLSSSVANFFYPALAVNANNVGIVGFDLSGSSNFPSAAYVHYTATGGMSSTIHIAAAGVNPEDGFTCYFSTTSVCRWGDYSAAGVDDTNSGQIWMANEYISGVRRDTQTNWGTTISAVPVP